MPVKALLPLVVRWLPLKGIESGTLSAAKEVIVKLHDFTGIVTLNVGRPLLLDPFQPGILFFFCGRRTDRIKDLLMGTGYFLLLYKRLEAGRFQWTRNEQEVLAVTPEQYTWLMQGSSIEQTRTIKKIQPEVPL
ncbi:IS66 family insertion sequence element accessory protein TnpB [Lachnospiraceae bacterium 54-53]